MDKYPKAKRIMDKPWKHKREVIKIMKDWKRTEWKKAKEKYSKRVALRNLTNNLCEIYNNPVHLEFVEFPSCYVTSIKTIFLDKLSIITLLHEIGHHLFGNNEEKACRFSVWLFKKTFPKSFAKLTFKKHMLIKNNKRKKT